MTSPAVTPVPLQHSQLSTQRVMLLVIAACVPGIGIATWFFGYGLLVNVLLASLSSLAFEALALKLSGRSPAMILRDNSALVAAVLFALAIPPGSPWWLTVIGIGFAIVIIKHVFGGLGENLFNPAMAGYLFLLLAFPQELSNWYLPNDQLLVEQNFSPISWLGFQQSLLASFPFLIGAGSTLVPSVDGLALATPLIEAKMAGHSALLVALDGNTPLFSRDSGTGWELVNLGYLGGGLFLLHRRIISWHIPLAILGTVVLLSLLFYSPEQHTFYGTPYLHLLSGATILGAFFIATDPVTAATTSRGKLYYGLIIGVSIYTIRVWGGYPDSVAVAVLIGNCSAPLLDHFCRPRIIGQTKLSRPETMHGERP